MSSLLPGAAVASVWIYQGLWCKLLGRTPRHQEIVGTVPFLSASWAHRALVALGLLECVIALWVLSGIRARDAALLQTLLLAAMNSGTCLGKPCHSRSRRHASSELRVSITCVDRRREPYLNAADAESFNHFVGSEFVPGTNSTVTFWSDV